MKRRERNRNEYTHIVIAGNPVDGFEYYGPFIDYDAALKWAENIDDVEWWVTTLSQP